MAVTLVQICDGIESTLSAAAGIQSSTSYDEITEGIPSADCPRLEVYAEKGTCDPSGNTDRTVFNAGMQQTAVVIHADLYARQRSQLDEDIKSYTDLTDALITVLQAQTKPDFFGVAGIKAFTWDWNRATFRRAGAIYAGARFRITCRIF